MGDQTEEIRTWFNIKKYEDLIHSSEKEWIELLEYRYLILQLLNKPKSDKNLGYFLANINSGFEKSWQDYNVTASSLFFEFIKTEPIKFKEKLGKLETYVVASNLKYISTLE